MRHRLMLPVLGAVATLLCATALTRLYAGFAWWFWPAAFGALVAVVVGLAVRRLRVPLPLHPVAYSIGLVCTATFLCARNTAWAWLIPTGRTVDALRELATAGRTDIRSLAAPVPERPGLVFLTLVGVYLVAALVDAIAVTLRRGSLAGLPLLGLFAVPTAVLSRGVGVVPFALGAAGYIALLLAEGRDLVGGWGRPLSARTTPDDGSPGSGALLGTTGRRIGLAALGVAVLLPLLIPGFGPGLFTPGGNGGFGAGDGPSSTSVVQPIVSLSQQLHQTETIPVLRVTTDDPSAYLRMTALEQFNGQTFTLGNIETSSTRQRIAKSLHGYAGSALTTTVHATVTISGSEADHYLPVPDSPSSVKGLHGDWRLFAPTSTIYSSRSDIHGAKYTVVSQVPTPSAAALPTRIGAVPAALEIDTQLPSRLDPRISQLARRIVAAAHATTPGQKVLAIEQYLKGPLFTYDLQGAPTTTNGALSEFLFTTRRGYCEQFASAMAVLVRTLGLPARVAIGFTGGTRQPDGSQLVTNKDAHAWPEVWFGSAGWLRFEPTKAGGDTNFDTPDYANIPGTTVPGQPPGTTATPTPAPGGSNLDQRKGLDNAGGGGQTDAVAAKKSHDSGPSTLVLAVGSLALLLVVAPGLIRLAVRRRRLGGFGDPAAPVAPRRQRRSGPRPGRGAAAAPDGAGRPRRRGRSRPTETAFEPADLTPAIDGTAQPGGRAGGVSRTQAAWRELLDLAADLGFPMRRSESPRAAATRLGGSLPPDELGSDGREALDRLADAEERALFAPRDVPLLAAGQLATDVRTAGRALRRSVSVRRRVRATLAPPSVVGRVRRVASRGVADALDSGDRLVARAAGGLGRWTRRRR